MTAKTVFGWGNASCGTVTDIEFWPDSGIVVAGNGDDATPVWATTTSSVSAGRFLNDGRFDTNYDGDGLAEFIPSGANDVGYSWANTSGIFAPAGAGASALEFQPRMR